MYPRPRWVTNVWMWLTDGQYDRIERSGLPDDHWRWEAGEKLQRMGCRVLCFVFRHKATTDCHIPEHDYCVFCNKPMPGQYPRSAT